MNRMRPNLQQSLRLLTEYANETQAEEYKRFKGKSFKCCMYHLFCMQLRALLQFSTRYRLFLVSSAQHEQLAFAFWFFVAFSIHHAYNLFFDSNLFFQFRIIFFECRIKWRTIAISLIQYKSVFLSFNSRLLKYD